MTVTIGRRDLLAALGGAAVAWPLAARAQQPAVPVVGCLHGGSPGPWAHLVAAFRNGLSDMGYVEGRNVAIEYRWANDEYSRLPDLVADLVRLRVAVIAVLFTTPGALAAKAATSTIPIVFGVGSDAVALGLVASLNRPEGNLTGVTLLSASVLVKRLELLHELVPTAKVIALLVNPTNPRQTELETNEAQVAARTLGLQLHVLNAGNEGEFETAFETLRQRGAGALLVQGETLFTTRRNHLVALAARHAVPAIYGTHEIVAAGGLMSYTDDRAWSYRLVGTYTGRILRGVKPADLPVVQPTKFEFVINLKTAKALGLEVPTKLLALTDAVIE
jgi:putative tryptophan/tyrosine transport system substrate-binding protein